MDLFTGLNRAMDYIEDNIREEIALNSVAAVTPYSAFHFQRLFGYLTDVSLSEYIRRRKMTLAAIELQSSNIKVLDLAVKYGYDSADSFCRAFMKLHGVTPSQARRKGTALKSYPKLNFHILVRGEKPMNYRIEEKEAFDVLALTRVFDEEYSAAELPAYWSDFFGSGYAKILRGDFGICREVVDGKFKYSIADLYKSGDTVPEGFEKFTIPASTWAVFTCVGAMPKAIQDMWKRVYDEWLPSSDYELAQTCDIERYTAGDNSRPDYVSEIWIPVRKK